MSLHVLRCAAVDLRCRPKPRAEMLLNLFVSRSRKQPVGTSSGKEEESQTSFQFFTKLPGKKQKESQKTFYPISGIHLTTRASNKQFKTQ